MIKIVSLFLSYFFNDSPPAAWTGQGDALRQAGEAAEEAR
jgi:hypothetical protein